MRPQSRPGDPRCQGATAGGPAGTEGGLPVRRAAVAARLDREGAGRMCEAIERYVEEETAVRAFIQAGEEAIGRGELFTQEQMEEWAESLGRRDAA